MKKALIYWYSLLAILVFMTSCKSKQPIIQNEIVKDSIVITNHDTIFQIEKDSSSIKALLECQNGKVVLKQITAQNSGRNLNTPKFVIEHNVLQVDCFSEAEKLFAEWKSTFIKSYKEINKPIVTNILTWWQKTQIYTGRLLFLILSLFILLKIFKFKIF